MSKTIHVRDFAGIKDVTLHPSGNLVVIAGNNGAGKSSLLNAVAELFNSKGVKLFPRPIREGADEAYAEYVDEELGLRISRTWKKDGTAGVLAVEALDGARYQRPSDVVASLTGGLLFDPLEFLQMDDRKQRDALLAKVELPFDLDVLAREKAGAEERRREAGRDEKRLQSVLVSMPNPLDAPDVEVSAAGILAEIETVQDHNHRIDRAEDLAAELGKTVVAFDRTIERLEAEIAQARGERAVVVERIESAERAASATRRDITSLQVKLAAVDDTNAAVRAKREYQRVADEYAAVATAHAAAQRDLDAIDRQKRDGLAHAVFPVPGLSVDESGVTFEGIPFVQTNTATRRKVAFAIATAGAPKLRLVIVRDGDLLDAESLDAIRVLAEERGYTVLCERDRDESRAIGFTIRDGELAEARIDDKESTP